MYLYTAWKDSFIYNTFENVGATISGVETAYNAMKKRGKIDETWKFIAFGGDMRLDTPVRDHLLTGQIRGVYETCKVSFCQFGWQLYHHRRLNGVTSSLAIMAASWRSLSKNLIEKQTITPGQTAKVACPFLYL